MYQSGMFEVETIWFGGRDFIFTSSMITLTETIVIRIVLISLIRVRVSLFGCGFHFIIAKEAIFGAGSSEEKEGAF